MAVNLFNHTWNLIDKENRTIEEEDDMIHSAHASRYHWGVIGEPINFERGEWLVSRVYSILKNSQSALHHAKRCLDICLKNSIGDFDIAFAYEALARAYAIAGNKEEYLKNLTLAKIAGEKIAKKDDKDYFLTELGNLVI
ncbi:MAG: hypothetical protein EAX90_09380 [Candidatus Heimdallarchaeota archaeon]|nr:hypothetical protein [Candidatus Heimdallarchaeota archaeon]